MTCMIDRWHDRYHTDTPEPLTCVYCADELIEAEREAILRTDIDYAERDRILAELHAYWDAAAQEWPEDDPATHDVACNCIFCIPGA